MRLRQHAHSNLAPPYKGPGRTLFFPFLGLFCSHFLVFAAIAFPTFLSVPPSRNTTFFVFAAFAFLRDGAFFVKPAMIPKRSSCTTHFGHPWAALRLPSLLCFSGIQRALSNESFLSRCFLSDHEHVSSSGFVSIRRSKRDPSLSWYSVLFYYFPLFSSFPRRCFSWTLISPFSSAEDPPPPRRILSASVLQEHWSCGP